MVETMDEQEKIEAKKMLAERLASLPKPVQDAITSADVENEMRALAELHKLHVDQWEALENSVLFTLLGFEKVEDLEKNIRDRVGVDAADARALAADISRIVFEPIRGELKTALGHPDAASAKMSDVESLRAQILANSPATVAPATPPTEPNTAKVVRAPISAAYKAGEPSSVRGSVEDDPYREQPA